ncbi:MAG: flagellar basal body rod protein FlgC [Candidatus Omnitrophica bacterium]|nr:flagellar basal body rod protein FlgC [Candidatus Omnitrophota bacterium]
MSFQGMDISASGLTAQRLRMDVISGNLANVNTTRTPEGGPYRRRMVVFEEMLQQAVDTLPFQPTRTPLSGVRVSAVVESEEPPMMVYDPQHPDANEEGYVAMPNVNSVHEMADMISASRAYEANLTAMNLSKTMTQKALSILRV